MLRQIAGLERRISSITPNWTNTVALPGMCYQSQVCAPSSERRVRRREHEYVLDPMQTRLVLTSDSMRIRRQIVEHPDGAIKL